MTAVSSSAAFAEHRGPRRGCGGGRRRDPLGVASGRAARTGAAGRPPHARAPARPGKPWDRGVCGRLRAACRQERPEQGVRAGTPGARGPAPALPAPSRTRSGRSLPPATATPPGAGTQDGEDETRESHLKRLCELRSDTRTGAIVIGTNDSHEASGSTTATKPQAEGRAPSSRREPATRRWPPGHPGIAACAVPLPPRATGASESANHRHTRPHVALSMARVLPRDRTALSIRRRTPTRARHSPQYNQSASRSSRAARGSLRTARAGKV